MNKERQLISEIVVESPFEESRFRWTVRSNALSFPWARIVRGLLTAVAFAALLSIDPAASTNAQDGTASKSGDVKYSSGPSVTGIVRTPDGIAAAQADVYLRHSPPGSITLPTHPLQTQTDSQGRFRFDDVAPGPYRLWAETDEFTSLKKKLGGLSVRVEETPAVHRSDIAVGLHVGCGYDVSIVSAITRQPIKGARISFGWTDIEREYTPDDDGIVRIRNLGSDDWYFIVQADGFATEFKRTSKQQLASVLPLEFQLSPGGQIIGTVRDEKGTPLADAGVSVFPGDVSLSPRYGRTQTDADGEFSFDGLPIGRPLRLSAGKNGYESGRLRFAVASSDAATRTDLVCIKRPYGGDVIVEVVAGNGSPIAGATVINRGSSTSAIRTAVTDVRGRAKLQDLFTRYDGCHVTVKAEHFIAKRVPVVPGTVEYPEELKVQLELGRTVRGVVVKPDGTPAPKLRVYYNGGESSMNDLGDRVSTDSDGRFVIHGLPDKSTVTVYTPREFAPIRKLPVPVSEQEFRIQMSIAGLIRVRALDADSREPLDEFNVRLGFCEIRKPDDPRARGISSYLINPGVNIQGTKKEFRLDGQVVGTPYKLIVSAEGYEPTTIARVEAQAADTAELLDVPLNRIRAEDYQTVAGRLIDADSNPIVGAQVRLLLGSEEPHRIDPFTLKRREDGWQAYHWGLLSRDDMENRFKCVQLLKSVSDSTGKFEFSGVKKGPPWMELYYFGNKLMSQRYSNLRSRTAAELPKLVLKAERPSTVRVIVDYAKYPSAHSVSLAAENYIQGPNALKLAFGHESKTLAVDESEVRFDYLPSGRYVAQLCEKPVTLDNGGYSVRGIASVPVLVSEGDDRRIRF